MKHLGVIALLFIYHSACRGQDTTIVISPRHFNAIDEILIADMDGWQFKNENDSNWIRLKPTQLSASMAGESGRLSGWLRFKFSLTNEFSNAPLGLRYYGWAAAQIYLDGGLIQSAGDLGVNGRPYHEFNPSNRMPVPINLQTGAEHLIMVHFTDYQSTLFPRQLKSQALGMDRFIRITGQAYNKRFAQHIREWPIYSTMWVSVFAVLTCLFWFLTSLKLREKNLRLFAYCATTLLLTFLCKIISESDQISFRDYRLGVIGFNFFGTVSSCLTVIIVGKVFKNRISLLLKIITASLFIVGIIGLLSASGVDILQLVFNLVPIGIYLSYIISSRKTLKGAQWALVIGLLIYCFFVFLYFAMITKYKTDFIPYNMLIATGIVLSFPLAMLVYVALRFKEIVNEVRQHAEQVVRLSDEKKEQALKQQKLLEEEVAKQTAELRTTLDNLKSTQSQLIQAEKMASLGELTAGIAHEIQNPLNFVNNFSEVSNELISELVEGVEKGNTSEIKSIAKDLQENLEKINNHGKRADAIVKGMLQHSRTSTGQKEPTDINALCDEYLRLAYHGLRAKDKNFNVKIHTAFNPAIGKTDVVPQDIGRVLLNLFNNAFYAVNEASKKNVPGYQPAVSITTKKLDGKIEIIVTDNGSGIPDIIKDKIFQPFFTTKPTGQGTGLGLSLSYDIIKSHGGEIRAETGISEGTSFIVYLPINPK